MTVTEGNLALTRFANSFIHQNVAEESATTRLRAAVDARVASSETTATDDAAIRRFVERAIDTARAQEPDPQWPGIAKPAGAPAGGSYDAATSEATPAERAAAVARFVAAGPGLSAAGYCSTEGWNVAFANSAGHTLEGSASMATVDGIHRTGDSAGSGHGSSVALGSLDAAGIGGLAAQRAQQGVGAFDVKPGEYEVVLGSEAVATIAVFTAYYMLNGKAANEGRAPLDVGDVAFDSDLEIVDDPTDRRSIGVAFDFEGTPARRLSLIADGALRAVAHDRTSAGIAGVESTGHAYPGSTTGGPMPTSLFERAGRSTVGDLIAGVSRGLYVATFNYCRVLDPKTLVVTGLTRNGTFLIENGAVTGAVTNLRFTQSFIDAMAPGAVLGLGNDDRLADSEFGPGVVHTPSARSASWNFTGGAAG